MNADHDRKLAENAAQEVQSNSGPGSYSAEDTVSSNREENACAASILPCSKSSAFTKAVYYWVLSRF